MATLGGARALGQQERLGSIEVGKEGDMIALDLSSVHHQPHYNLASSIVYASTGGEVAWSWIAGKAVIRSGQLCTLDPAELRGRTAAWSARISDFRATLEH
jgi:5-methylthioadenosine/S-adenosylhomocysteine deaminase